MSVAVSGASSGVAKVTQLPQTERPLHVSSRWKDNFDKSHRLISGGRVTEGMDLLAGYLSEMRQARSPQAWEEFCQSAIEHPVGSLVWQDPFTHHSFQKPRGYAGDAQLLDYIYGANPPPRETTALGSEVFDYMMRQAGAQGVRGRAQILARMIDETAQRVSSPRILSIACGHLREVTFSVAMTNGGIGEFLALDQDPDSLAQVERQFSRYGVQTVHSSVRSLLTGKTRFENLNLVYAAGLYDYLSDRVATRLTSLMFGMLAPGGRVLIANFAPFLPETGYMESFMGWKLIYRHASQLQALSSDISANDWTSSRLFWDESESIIFLELIKRQSKLQLSKALLNRVALPGKRKLIVNADRERSSTA